MTTPIKATGKTESLSFFSFFTKKDRGLRFVIGLLCLICLTLFLHFREVKVELLELHSISGGYVTAQVDFEFPDDQQTLVSKQNAITDIGTIYRLRTSDLHEVRYDFENYLIQQPLWRQYAPAVSFEKMYRIADALEDYLLDLRFAEPKTIKRIKKYDLPTASYLPFTIVAANPGDLIPLPAEYWSHLKEISFKGDLKEKFPDVSKETMDFVLHYFESHQLILMEDPETQNSIKQLITQRVSEQHTQVKAGARIIGPGEKVTPRHIVMIESMKKTMEDNRDLFSIKQIGSSFLLALVFMILFALYFRMEHPKIYFSLQKSSLVLTVIILTLTFAKITEYIILKNPAQLMQSIQYPLFVPFAAILFTILLNLRVALFCSFSLTVILAMGLAVDSSHFLIMNLVASLATVLSAKSLRKRTEIFIVCGKCFLAVVPIIFAFSLANGYEWRGALSTDFGSTLLFLSITAVLAVGLLPILESLFNVMTDMTLMEYTDPNNELLRRLTLEIPGTYHHSLVLGNIAESAAQAIGANGLLCRVATLYHDVGKLQNSHYFSENQPTSVNIHQLLTPQESAQVIISHVKAGEEIAKKYHLPQPIVDTIAQHHGTTLVYYFYCKELEQVGRPELVDEEKFRYPGPKPQTKEIAIIMIADAIEAASRSMHDVTQEAFLEKINQVIRERANDGQFNECDLTFKDIETIKKTIASTLLASHHVRIKYPEKNGFST